MRRRSVAVVAVVLVLGTAACGGSSTKKNTGTKVDSLAVLAAAQSTTTAAKSAKVSMTVLSDIAGQSITISGDGAFDFARKLGKLSMQIPNPQSPTPLSIDAVFSGTTFYMHSDAFTAIAGKSWLKIDLSTFTGDASKLGAQDPTSGLAFLAGTKSARVVGTEQVHGTSTTHYAATIDLDAALAKVGSSAKKLIDQYRASIGSGTMPVDVWIDDAGRVARMAVKIDIKASAATHGQAGSTKVTTEYYDWGSAVTVALPKPAEVADGTSLLAGLTGG